MNAQAIEQIECFHCTTALDVDDNFCRNCGTPTVGGDFSGSLSVASIGRPKPLDNPLVILGLLFFVLGPFALPLLYKSRAFPTAVKILLTIIVLIIAVAAVWVTLYFMRQFLAPLKQFWQEWQELGTFG